jgi:hypothetical protein
MTDQKALKKLILVIVLVLIPFGILIWLWVFLNTSNLTIITNNPNNDISLRGISDPNFSINTKGGVETSLHNGKYTLTVTGNSNAISQVVDLKSRQHLTLTLNPKDPSGVEPVINREAQNLAINKDHLVYLDQTSSLLYQVDSQNLIKSLNNQRTFSSVKWADANYGIAQADNSEQLFRMNNGSISSLELPFSYDGKNISYSISKDRGIFVAHEGNVYYAKNDNFKKVYTSKSKSLFINSGGSNVLVAAASEEEGENSDRGIVVVNSSGKVFSANDINAYVSAWSPDGEKVAVSSDSGGLILDKKLKKIATIPTGGIGSMVWLNNDTLFYSSNDSLWRFDISNEKSQIIANAPLGGQIIETAINEDLSYIYLSVSDANDSLSVKKVGLKNQVVPDYVFKLQDVLPKSEYQYTIELINFTRLVVWVHSVPNVPSVGYEKAATEDLRSDGFNTSNFELRFGL